MTLGLTRNACAVCLIAAYTLGHAGPPDERFRILAPGGELPDLGVTHLQQGSAPEKKFVWAANSEADTDADDFVALRSSTSGLPDELSSVSEFKIENVIEFGRPAQGGDDDLFELAPMTLDDFLDTLPTDEFDFE